MSVVDEIKARIDIVDIVSQYVQLKKAGRVYKGLCPFHSEKTPSFVVYPDEGRYHCFGCGADGDVFTFLEQKEGLTFPEALKVLAQKAGVELPDRRESPEEKSARERLYALLSAAAGWYRTQLASPAGAGARAYLVKRGITPETSELFGLGFAPDSWDACQKYLRGLGYTEEEIVSSGISIAKDTGGSYDRFRGRLMIPIRDDRGRVSGFGARVIGKGEPKYLNSPQTEVFDKGRMLFGIDMARRAIREKNAAVVVEGYMDVISAVQRGVRNVVASMGTALTEHHIRYLKRLTRNIYLALDPDAAGIRATLRGLDVAKDASEEELVPVALPGMIKFKSALDVALYVIPMPEGLDPDDVFREHPEIWPDLLQGAIPLVEFALKLLAEEYDLTSPEGKSQAAKQGIALLKNVLDDVERSHYVQMLARMVSVDPRLLERQLWEIEDGRRTSRRRRRPVRLEPQKFVVSPAIDMERRLLQRFLEDASRIERLVEALAEEEMEPISELDFGSEAHRQVFLWLSGSGEINDAIETVVDDLRAGASELPPIEIEGEATREMLETLLRLREYRLRERLRELEGIIEESFSEDHTAELIDLVARLKSLQDALARYRPRSILKRSM